MARYRVSIRKVLEDGSEVEMVSMCEPGWYVSPVLKALARQTYEPAPQPNYEGQLSLDVTDAA